MFDVFKISVNSKNRRSFINLKNLDNPEYLKNLGNPPNWSNLEEFEKFRKSATVVPLTCKGRVSLRF